MTRSDSQGEQPRRYITCRDWTAVSRSRLLFFLFFLIFSQINGGSAKDNEEALEVVENVNEETERATRTHVRTRAHKDATRAIFSGKQKKTPSSKWADLSFIRRRRWDEATAWRMKDSEGLFFTLAPLNCFSLNRGSAAYRFLFISGHPWGWSHTCCAVFIFHIVSLGQTKRLPEVFAKSPQKAMIRSNRMFLTRRRRGKRNNQIKNFN